MERTIVVKYLCKSVWRKGDLWKIWLYIRYDGVSQVSHKFSIIQSIREMSINANQFVRYGVDARVSPHSGGLKWLQFHCDYKG